MTDWPPKPKEGQPCNGCGYCCMEEPCQVAESVLHIDPTVNKPCPALEWQDGRFYCGLIRNMSRYTDIRQEFDGFMGAMFSKWLGVGEGCCASDP
jgi:hypothetical protein